MRLSSTVLNMGVRLFLDLSTLEELLMKLEIVLGSHIALYSGGHPSTDSIQITQQFTYFCSYQNNDPESLGRH